MDVKEEMHPCWYDGKMCPAPKDEDGVQICGHCRIAALFAQTGYEP